MKYLLLLLILVNTALGLTENEEKIVSKYYEKYEKEWSELSPVYKANIYNSYRRGVVFGLGYSSAGITFIETRGVPKRINANISKKRARVLSYDCGLMGSNTYYYLKYRGVEKPTHHMQMKACLELDTEPEKSFTHFLNVILDATERKDIAKFKGTKKYWRLIWNYYNTGKITYSGKYYLKGIAIVRLLKKVMRVPVVSYEIDLEKIKTVVKKG